MGCSTRSLLRSSFSFLVASTLMVGWLPAEASASALGAPEAKPQGAATNSTTTKALDEAPGSAPASPVEAGSPDNEPQPVPPPEESVPQPAATAPAAPASETSTPGWDQTEPQAGPTPVPAPVDPQPQPKRPRPSRAGLAMMISGFSLFGASWLISAFVGAAAIDLADDEADPFDAEEQKEFGTRLMIPVGGPFAAAFAAPSATGALVSVLDGVAQVTGLTLGIVGSVMFGRAKARAEQMRISFTPAPGGGYARFGMRF